MILDNVIFLAAHQAGVERVCFTSSACVYPVKLQQASPAGEMVYLREELVDSYAAGGADPDGEYGWAKLMGEVSLAAYHKQHGLKCVSCRLFTAYGERENETHAVIALIAKALARLDPYPIWGTGEQDRNFTYVGDIADGLILAAEKIEDGSAVNLGANTHIKIREVAEKVFEYTGFHPMQISFDTGKPIGVFSRSADGLRAQRLLGWEPKTTFDEGLRRTIDWYSRMHDIESLASRLELPVNDN